MGPLVGLEPTSCCLQDSGSLRPQPAQAGRHQSAPRTAPFARVVVSAGMARRDLRPSRPGPRGNGWGPSWILGGVRTPAPARAVTGQVRPASSPSPALAHATAGGHGQDRARGRGSGGRQNSTTFGDLGAHWPTRQRILDASYAVHRTPAGQPRGRAQPAGRPGSSQATWARVLPAGWDRVGQRPWPMPPHCTALREDRLTPPRESDSDPHRTALWTWTRLRPSPS